MTDNKATLRRVPEEIFTGNLDLVDELFTSDYVMHDPGLPEEVAGTEGFKGYVSAFRSAMPDIKITVEDQIAEGDVVATRWTGRGTHEGDMFGVPGTGRAVTIEGIIITRFEGGKIAEEWTSYDAAGALRQVGALN
jgi:steroid delta-isomerase-like uncharacterized protein